MRKLLLLLGVLLFPLAGAGTSTADNHDGYLSTPVVSGPIYEGGQGTIDSGVITNYSGCWPGDGCTIHLAGHRTSHGSVFAGLPGLSGGDSVVITYQGTDYRYVVVDSTVVNRFGNIGMVYGDLVLQTSKSGDDVYLFYADFARSGGQQPTEHVHETEGTEPPEHVHETEGTESPVVTLPPGR